MKVNTLMVASLVACALLGSASAQTLNPPNQIDYQQKSITNGGVIQFSETIQAVGNPLFVIANCSTTGGLLTTNNCVGTPNIKTSGGQTFTFTLVYHTSSDSGDLGSDVWYLIPATSGSVTVNVGFTFSSGQLDAAEQQIQGPH